MDLGCFCKITLNFNNDTARNNDDISSYGLVGLVAKMKVGKMRVGELRPY